MTRPARVTGTNNPNRQVSVNAWNAVVDKLNQRASVFDYGAVADGVTDDTAAFAAAFAAASRVHAPAGIYALSSVVIPAGCSLETDGKDTIFQQLSGQPIETRVLIVGGSNVNIGDCKIVGNIATDTDEQNHGIYCQANATRGSLRNIVIGNIDGEDIRGDVVYCGTATGYTLSAEIGNVHGVNIYRDVVTIAGGNVSVGDITGSEVGYFHLNAEPNPGNSTTVVCRSVKGRHIGAISQDSVNPITMQVAEVDLSPSNAGQSTPAYSATLLDGIQTRNCASLKIGKLKVSGFDRCAFFQVYNSGELADQSVDIGYCDVSDCANTDLVYQAYLVGAQGVTKFTVGYLKATTDKSGDAVVRAMTFARIAGAEVLLASGSSFMRACQDTVLIAPRVTGSGIVCNGCDRVTLSRGSLTGDRLFSNSTGGLADGVVSTMTTGQVVGTVSNHLFRNSTLGGTFYQALFYASTTTASFTIGATGALTAGADITTQTTAAFNATGSGYYKVNGAQVISARKTGWGAATGTATRTSFDPATVTTAQLAERVKALIDDLISHGLIGG